MDGRLPTRSLPVPAPAPSRQDWLTPALWGGAAALAGLVLGARWAGRRPRHPDRRRAEAFLGRRLDEAARMLALSALADSALEHYRGRFHDPFMYAAPAAAAMTLAVPQDGGRDVPHAAAALTGAVGTGFHVYNVAVRREGGFSWNNLFYGAPLGAPASLTLAGLAGLAATRLRREAGRGLPPRLLGLPAAPVVAAGTVAGLLGTTAEVALLHFRGAFQDPWMYVPVSLPPAAAATLALAFLRPTPATLAAARRLLEATALMGLAGAGFHAYGVQRNMGGWRNWSQMVLQGPPIPAPPSFAGVALAGLGALDLHEEETR